MAVLNVRLCDVRPVAVFSIESFILRHDQQHRNYFYRLIVHLFLLLFTTIRLQLGARLQVIAYLGLH